MAVIKLDNVSLLRDERSILKNVSWEVKKGQHWAIIGRNGSGKTLTLKIVCGYLWPSVGSVQVLDKNFGQIDLRLLRRQIGWVTPSLEYQLQQNSLKVQDIVYSGIFASIGLYDELSAEQKDFANQQIEFMHCTNLADRSFSTLSTGEQKRVIIARALAAKPDLLILDEPATGLDIASREDFLDKIKALSDAPNKPTIIYVSHHIEEILPFITHCILLKNGQVLAQGEKEEILTDSLLSECLDKKLEIKTRVNRYFVDILN